jgi:hypothetical protein
MTEFKLPNDLGPRELVRWGTAIFVLALYVLFIVTAILALFGVWP